MTTISEAAMDDQLPEGSGTWGLKNATWKQIEGAIELVGGRFVRTGSNGHRIFELNGTSLTLVKSTQASQPTGRSTLAGYIKRIAEAGIQPALFVAALGSLGAGWTRQSTDLRELERLVRLNKGLARYDKGRGKLIETAMENLKRKEIERHAPEEEVADKPREYTHKMVDAIRLGLGEEGSKRFLNRFQTRFSKQISEQRGFGHKLIQEGHLHRLGEGKGSTWMMSEEGAMLLAHHVETSATEEGILPITGPRPPEREWKKAPEPTPEPTPEPAPQPAPEPEPKLAPREHGPFQDAGEALLYLCRRFGVEPQWIIGTYQLADRKTIMAIANKVREQE